MFERSFIFDQPLGSWNIENVSNMYKMFYYARSFTQLMDSWNLKNVKYKANMYI
jgi:hypothetical protein